MFTVKVDLSQVTAWRKTIAKEIEDAAVKALNDTAFDVRKGVQAEMQRAFDNPTPYVLRNLVVDQATANRRTAVVGWKYPGGKGVDPNSVLMAEIFGGGRKHKRAEVALQRVGILPKGMYLVPGDACPLDAHGNVAGSFIVQLLSYFQAFGEQGYRANMSAKRKTKIEARGRSANGYASIGGVAYFVSRGRGEFNGRAQHLRPGIWAKTGTHGSSLKPILMFVKAPKYSVRLRFRDVAERVIAQKWERNFAYRVKQGGKLR